MPCVDKKEDISRKRNKDGRIITTKTRRVVCGDRTEDLQENQEQEHLEPFETLIYPSALKGKAEMADVVVEDARTGTRYTKKVPVWSLEEPLDPDLIQQNLLPPKDEQKSLKEVFSRYL